MNICKSDRLVHFAMKENSNSNKFGDEDEAIYRGMYVIQHTIHYYFKLIFVILQIYTPSCFLTLFNSAFRIAIYSSLSSLSSSCSADLMSWQSLWNWSINEAEVPADMNSVIALFLSTTDKSGF